MGWCRCRCPIPRLGDRDIQVLTMPKRVLPESLAFFIDTLIARLQKEG